jgi:uncharacterized protein
MKYRSLGNTGIQVSEISLGTEYLINLPPGNAEAVLQKAIAGGVNYFDLFFANPAFRDTMGSALAPYRKQINLAAHLGVIDVNGQYDKTREVAPAEAMFEDFLRRYHTDYVDVAFVHNVDDQAAYDRTMQPDGLLGLAQKLKTEGKARVVAFSGHTVATSQAAAESGQIEAIMFPLNIAGHAVPGRQRFLQVCAERGVGVIAMKPFAGGKLLQPEMVLNLEKWHRGGDATKIERKSEITPIQCLHYVLSLPGISNIVPGCKTLKQLDEALVYYDATSTQQDYGAVLAGFDRPEENECVYCNHCLPCPSGIDIGHTIRILETSGRPPASQQRAMYAALPAPASTCIGCGECTPRCPFGVDAQARIAEAAIWFETRKS